MLYKITRTTCEKVRSQMKKAQKINRRATLIWAMRRVILPNTKSLFIINLIILKAGHSLNMFRPS